MRASALFVFTFIAVSCGGSGSPDGGSGGGSALGGGIGTGGGSTGGGGGAVGGGGGAAGGGSGGGGGTSDAGTVTVATLQMQVFVGCFGEGCHSCGFLLPDSGCEWTTKPMALYGSPQQFCDSVVNVSAISSPTKVRVKPFDPDNSFMVQKLEGHLDANEGSQMPPGRVLTADQIQLLRDWISQGAQPF